MSTVGSNPTPSSISMTFQDKIEFLEERRIYVLVTPTVLIEKTQSDITLTHGRMTAQACHAVSKVKFNYIEYDTLLKVETGVVIDDKLEWAQAFLSTPVTTIVLEVRNQKELKHVVNLAISKSLPNCSFHDTNNEFYGSPEPVWTALAIGPVMKDEIIGICDYLPLL